MNSPDKPSICFDKVCDIIKDDYPYPENNDPNFSSKLKARKKKLDEFHDKYHIDYSEFEKRMEIADEL